MASLPLGLACKRCGEVFGIIFTPITPSATPLVSACSKCLGEVMQGKPATTPDEWAEVEKKLGSR